MHAGRRLRIQSAQLFKTAAGAGFESIPALADAMFDGRIVANIEMEKGTVFKSSPIAAVQHTLAADIEGSRDDPAFPLGEDQAQMIRKAFQDGVEELLGQILPSIIKPGHVSLVQPVHCAHLGRRQFASLYRTDHNSLLRDRLPFSPDLVAPVATKTTQIVFERAEAVILPMKLQP